MEREHIICFVCRNKTTSILNDEGNWGARRRTTASRLENNLDVIFILRNLLQVPSNELESQLRGCGDHPEDWISLCDQCTQLTDKARYLHQEIKEIRKHLWEKISLSSTDDDSDEGNRAYHGSSTAEFHMRIRSFVKQNNDKDGFLEGDKLANYLASQQNSYTAQIVTVDKPVDVVEEVIEMDVELESPSLSSPPLPPSSSPPAPAAEKGDLGNGNSFEKPDAANEHSIKTTGKPKRKRRRRVEVEVKKKRKTIKKKDEPALRCNLCDKEFKGKNILKSHIRYVHEKKFNFGCHVCGLGARTKKDLNTHLLAVHSEDPVSKRLEMEEGLKLSRCTVVGCFAQYLNKEKLDEHVERMHGGEKGWSVRFKCKLCGKGFWGKHKLEAHEDTHVIVTERNWKCGVCGNGFGTERNLRFHELKIHKIYKKDRIAQN